MAFRPGLETAAPILLVLAALAVSGGCDGERPTPVATPAPGFSPPPGPPGVTEGRATGPTTIALVAIDPSAGSSIPCGSHAQGCTGRVRMSFRLTPTGTGTVLWCTAFLHAADKTACLQGRAPGFLLRTGEPRLVDVVFDIADAGDRCRTPLELTDLAFVAEGTVEVAARQEWTLRYHLTP